MEGCLAVTSPLKRLSRTPINRIHDGSERFQRENVK